MTTFIAMLLFLKQDEYNELNHLICGNSHPGSFNNCGSMKSPPMKWFVFASQNNH